MNFELILKIHIVSALFMEQVDSDSLRFRRGSPLLIGVRSEHKLSTDHIPILYRTGKLSPYIVSVGQALRPCPYVAVMSFGQVSVSLCIQLHVLSRDGKLVVKALTRGSFSVAHP